MNIPPLAEESFTVAPPPALVNQRWRPWVRALWLTCAGLTLVVFAISLPVYWAQLQIICHAPVCPPWQTLPSGALAIQQVGFSLHDWTLLEVVVTGINEVIWLAVGVVIFWKKSQQWIALVVALYLAVFVVNLNNNLDALAALSPVWRLPVAFVVYLGGCLPLAVFFLFPDGHFTPHWTRWLTLAFCVANLALAIAQLESNNLSQQSPTFQAFFMALGLTGVGAQIFRYARRSSPRQRQQTKWVVFGIASAMLGLLVVNVTLPDVMTGPRSEVDLLGGVITLALFALIPSSIGVALLREKLWDIDILINRTLVYGALSGCVVGIYILVVGYLGALFQTGNTLPISLVATGLVAVGFQPIRTWLQRGVNRLLYGRRDEPYAVVASLGRRLEKTLAPEAMLQASVDTVAQALKLPYAAILLKHGATFRPAAVHGAPVDKPLTLPLSYQSEVIGQLALGPRQRDEDFSLTDRRLLEDLARQVSIAVHAVQLTAELQHSRERLVTAREEERRRLRRDLHDGLGPTLGGLTLKVGAIRNLMPTNQVAADTLLEELSDEIQLAVSDIRRLVYDLRPPSLDELGLIGAIRAHAVKYGCLAGEQLSADHPTNLFIEIEAPEHLPPLPAAVEVAAYRIILESLTNVARHAQATRCHIRLQVSTMLMIDVTDDGKGLVMDHPAGVGLVSIRERAAELGGACQITSPMGGGGPGTGSASHTKGGIMVDRLSVVIADDHPIFRGGMRALLNSAPDMQVLGEASDGEEAVRLAAELQPDVMLMDVRMPGIGGLEATRRILHTSPHISVLIVTMFEDEDTIFAALQAGARGYVLKGATPTEMVRAIQAAGSGEAIFSPAIAQRIIDFFATPRSAIAPQAFPEMTDREREVLTLIARGHKNPEIAQLLSISLKTVRNHISNIFSKLQVADRAQAILRAREAGLG